jgi:AcrR family transcriptional regulator
LRLKARSVYKHHVPKRSIAATTQTRESILARAVDLASIEGLEGLTIGRLASAHSMSKSGLFAHFGSKEELQLAVIEAARDVFVREVLQDQPALGPGLPRLRSLALSWLRYIESGLFRGGCFFAAASAEMDDRPGRVRDRIVELTRHWMETLSREAEAAVEAGHLARETDPPQLAFELHAYVQEANWAFQLHGDSAAFDRARRAIDRSLRIQATTEGLGQIDADGG